MGLLAGIKSDALGQDFRKGTAFAANEAVLRFVGVDAPPPLELTAAHLRATHEKARECRGGYGERFEPQL